MLLTRLDGFRVSYTTNTRSVALDVRHQAHDLTTVIERYPRSLIQRWSSTSPADEKLDSLLKLLWEWDVSLIQNANQFRHELLPVIIANY